MKNDMLKFATLTPDDVDFIINRLWQRGEEEAVLWGLKSKEEHRAHLLSMAKKHGYCLSGHDDEPIAAFGVCEPPDGITYSTWFIATDRFTEVGLSITKFLRGFIREKLKGHPEAEIELISAVSHADAGRWFQILGFEYKDSERVFSRYVYNKQLKEVDIDIKKQDDTTRL